MSTNKRRDVDQAEQVGGIEPAEAKQVDIQQNGDVACVDKCGRAFGAAQDKE